MQALLRQSRVVHTTMSFTFTLAFLCSSSWISVSVSEFHTMEVQPGEDVTLMCSNFSRVPSHILWFKLANEANASCISSMFSSDSNANLCDGYKDGHFLMTSNNTNIFLQIQQVDFSDSGLYFCGYYKDEHPVIFGATYLQVKDVFVGLTNLQTVILSNVTVFFVMVVISLVVKFRIFPTDQHEGQNPQQNQNLDPDTLKHARLTFSPRATSISAPETELQTDVVYTVTR